VLPKFKTFFEDFDARLPLPTRMLLWVTDFLGSWWWALLGGIAATVILFVISQQFERGKYAWHSFVLKVPVLGSTIQYALVERFCRVMASMVSAGVNLPEAIQVATDSLRNRVFIKRLNGVTEQMLEGQGIAGPLARTQLFPGTATSMLRVGEDTGTMDAQLQVTADYYEVELDYKIAKLTALFEPIVIVFMGGIVGFVAIALVSAMYGIFQQVNV
jgi:type IV pilus assembly protein PilC